VRPGLVTLGRSGSRIAMADHGLREGIGGRNAGGPASPDRRQNLHRQRKQDYGQKILQPPMHRQTHPLPPNHRQSRESRSGSGFILSIGHESNSRGRRRFVSAQDRAAFFAPTPLPRREFRPRSCNQNWCNPNHFADCWNFEQSLLKLMTRRQRWSRHAGSGWPQGKSGGPSLGRSPTRTSSVTPSIKIKSEFSGK
jgi:hypothetical protein